MLLLKLAFDFVYDNVNITVGLMVSYLDSVTYYMQWLIINFIVATPDFKITELKTTLIQQYNVLKEPLRG